MKGCCNIIFGGVGGQGVLKASAIAGLAALYAGYHVKKSEVHGMAQRGGSVESHLRFGENVYSPLVPVGGADFLVCFHVDEREKLLPFLREGGSDLTDKLSAAEAAVTNEKFLNTFMVGVLSGRLDIGLELWVRSIEEVFGGKFVEENKKVFMAGRSEGAK